MREHYGQWLAGYSWQLFFTGTYDLDRQRCSPRGPHPEAALKHYLSWVRGANEVLHGRRHDRRGIPGLQWCMALELQRRGVVHCHAVVADPTTDLSPYSMASARADLRELWYRDHGIARLEVAESREAVSSYVCKYVVKDGEFEISHRVDQVERAPGGLLARSAEA